MIGATRRQALLGAMAVPTLAAAPALRGDKGAVVVYDPALAPPPVAGALAIAGDPIHFARKLFESRPSLVIGVSRHADALLIADVAREGGYVPVSQTLDARYGWALASNGRLPQP